jgi:hypothetical protein
VRVLVAAVAIGVSARQVYAQEEPSDCVARSAKVLRARPEQFYPNMLLGCPVSGPATLALLWSRHTSMSPGERIALRDASGMVRDARVFDAVLRVVRSPRHSTPVRFAALSVLLRYNDNSYGPVDADFLADPAGFRLLPQMTDVPTQIDGAVKVPRDVRRLIGAELAQRAWADEDETFRKVAHRVRAALAFHDPENTPVREGSIALIAGCGDRVTLRSSADVDLPVEVRVLGTNFANRGGIRGGTEAKPARVLLGLPAGIVVASLGGRELARLEERNAPCPPGLVRTVRSTQLDSVRGTIVLEGTGEAPVVFLLTKEGRRLTLEGRYTTDLLRQLERLDIVAYGRRRRILDVPMDEAPVEMETFSVRGYGPEPARDGILRRTARGDELELADGRRLAIAHLPEYLATANGKRIWISGPLEAPKGAGVIDSDRHYRGPRWTIEVRP